MGCRGIKSVLTHIPHYPQSPSKTHGREVNKNEQEMEDDKTIKKVNMKRVKNLTEQKWDSIKPRNQMEKKNHIFIFTNL